MFGLPILFLIISIILWRKYGKDEKVMETVEFYPPEGFNSLEVAQLYKGKAEKKDVISLLIYLANKGYIKITEMVDEASILKSKEYKITELKKYDGDNITEKLFLKGLFMSKDTYKRVFGKNNNQLKQNEVTLDELENKFYRTIDKILVKVNSKQNKILEKSSGVESVVVKIMIMISLITIMYIPALEVLNFEELIENLEFILYYLPFFIVVLFLLIKFLGKRVILMIILLPLVKLPVVEVITSEKTFLYSFLVGAMSIIGMSICLKFMDKRTEYGNKILGKIMGFKKFLETVEKEKLESLVLENPTYFYDILPYTYVLDISNKWISEFESIGFKEPKWYTGSSTFTARTFGRRINRTMFFANYSLTAISVSSRIGENIDSRFSDNGNGSSGSGLFGGGSSGGGFSGGGFGGGGGGSW